MWKKIPSHIFSVDNQQKLLYIKFKSCPSSSSTASHSQVAILEQDSAA